jgi:hypothetical protein
MLLKQLILTCIAMVSIAISGNAQVKVDRLQILSFRLTENRIVPAASDVQKGKYLIRLSNGVTGGSVQFELVKRGGAAEKVADKQLRSGKAREEVYLDLQPGDYDLRVVGQPKWVATLKVRP